VDEVQVPGSDGYLGVLPGHTPLLANLNIGHIWYRIGSRQSYLAVSLGYTEVLPDKVTILATVAELAEEIDRERATEARERAESQLRRRSAEVDFARAQLALRRSLVRLQVSLKAQASAP
jgi:F-type H+-transporting ATPase subunit epsilon|tara:strand:+ start:1972 stop:2331 length:360 start_codon:yes stop_codon:yes gene_type:complete